MNETTKIGSWGEDQAKNLLLKKGFVILDTNWRFDHKEIDIIAQTRNIIVFIEVKTRHIKYLEDAIESVHIRKQNFLIDAAEAYLQKKGLDTEIRFDIVLIFHAQENMVKVEHIENAFQAEL